MKNQKQYKIKLTALSPIHIGTGEDYEPTNFVIDDGFLYEFDEFDFYENLSSSSKEVFDEIVSYKNAGSLFKIHSFIKHNKKAAIDAKTVKVQVSKGIANDYHHKIGKVVQNEGKGKSVSKVFNKFQIARTARDTNNSKVYIPGSSIKGSISTALQEVVFKNSKQKWENDFHNRNPSLNIMKNILISDAKPLKTYAMIGYSNNKERFEDDELGPSNKLETIYTKSEFEVTISFKNLKPEANFDIQNILSSCNSHYFENFDSMFSKDDYVNEYFPESFYEKYLNFKLKQNQFLLRVGKHSGARAVTIDGMRKIKIHEGGGGPKKKKHVWLTKDEETTTWLFGSTEKSTQSLLPFGWVLCELID